MPLTKVNVRLGNIAFQVLVTQLVVDAVVLFVDLSHELAACRRGDSAAQRGGHAGRDVGVAGDEVHLVEAGEVYSDLVTLVVVIVVSHSHRERADDHQEGQTKDQPAHCYTPLPQ